MSEHEIQVELAKRYSSLGRRQQELYLGEVAYRLTLDGRTTYEVPAKGGIAEGAKMRAINEAVHRVLDHLTALLRGAEPLQRRPDEVVAQLLIEVFREARLDPVRLLKYLP